MWILKRLRRYGEILKLFFESNYSKHHNLSGIAYSSIKGGTLTIQDNKDVIFELDVPKNSSMFIPFNPPKKLLVGHDLTISITDGKVNACEYWETYQA